MDISFVILTWNSEKYIEKCLSSIAVSFGCGSLTYEVLIVDNGSKDDTITIIKDYKKKLPFELKLTILEKNMGTTYPRNLAITMARGLYLCVMDSDVELYPEVIEKLKSNLEKDPSIGLTVPRLLYPSGNLQKSIDEFPTVFRKVYRYFFLKQLEKKENREYKLPPPQYVDYAISAVWFLKKMLWIVLVYWMKRFSIPRKMSIFVCGSGNQGLKFYMIQPYQRFTIHRKYPEDLTLIQLLSAI